MIADALNLYAAGAFAAGMTFAGFFNVEISYGGRRLPCPRLIFFCVSSALWPVVFVAFLFRPLPPRRETR